MLLSRCHKFPTVTGALFRYGSHMIPSRPIRYFQSGRDLNDASQIFAAQHAHQEPLQFNPLLELPQDPVTVTELDRISVAATPNAVSNSHYWQQIPFWKDASEADFLSYQWQVK